MSDRLTEIRARLDALNAAPPFSLKWQEQLHHAPGDIAWLLEEVDNLNKTLNEWMTFCGSNECGLQRKAGAA